MSDLNAEFERLVQPLAGASAGASTSQGDQQDAERSVSYACHLIGSYYRGLRRNRIPRRLAAEITRESLKRWLS